MKKMLCVSLILFLYLLAFTAPVSAEYAPLGVTQEERQKINLFLTNFAEQGMSAFNRERAVDAQLIEFAIRHIRLNRRDLIEHGSFGEDTLRIAKEHIAQRTQRYLGLLPAEETAAHQRYENGYFYFSEGSDLRMGFACMSAAEQMDDGNIGVYFGVYASGDNWNAEDLKLRPEQAARRYPESQVECGYAVIELGTGGLSERSSWTLMLYDTLLQETGSEA